MFIRNTVRVTKNVLARKTGHLSFCCDFNTHWHTSLVARSCVCVLKPEEDACQIHLFLIRALCWVQRSAWGSKVRCDWLVWARFLNVEKGLKVALQAVPSQHICSTIMHLKYLHKILLLKIYSITHLQLFCDFTLHCLAKWAINTYLSCSTLSCVE